METRTVIQAAMFAALGAITKLSRSGYSVVFTQPVMGRNDLFGDEEAALDQARQAGLDLKSVTLEQVVAWQEWYTSMRETRRTGPEAHFLITRQFRLQIDAHTLEPANRVTLIDGWGEHVDSASFLCIQQWDREAINLMGRRGAVASHVNYDAINRWIEMSRLTHPEFAQIRVLDNNS